VGFLPSAYLIKIKDFTSADVMKLLLKEEIFMNNLIRHRRMLDKLHKTYAKKNSDYGDSFTDTMNKFGIEVGIARICDKYKRLENMALGKHMNVNESMKDCLLDMANYAIMLSMYLDEKYPNGDYSEGYNLELEDYDGDFDDDYYGMNQDIADGYVNSKNTNEFDKYMYELCDKLNADLIEQGELIKQRKLAEEYLREHPEEFYNDFDHWINEEDEEIEKEKPNDDQIPGQQSFLN
jgi:hypothetical protein